MNNKDYCKEIVKGLENAYNNDTLYDYINECLDYTFTVNSDLSYRSVEILVTFGGPNIYINTSKSRVELYWGNEYADYSILYDTNNAIDDIFEEIYNSRRD